MTKLCDECETVAHCLKHGCIPKQTALDKKAENARELGLDYEPVWDNLPSNKDVEDAMRIKRLNQLATPPAAQRTWVGLTDEEKRQIFEREDYQGWLDYINTIEAKLKERNQ
jgi:DNA topoisomerase IB